MASWSKRRKTIYAVLAVFVAIVIIGVPAYLIFYRAPTCFDGIKNGAEQGVDCGGACEKLCPSAFIPPTVAWTRYEEVGPGLYNIAAYIINQNTEAEAIDVPYRVAVYDNEGILITDTTGVVTLPPRRNALAFQSAVSVGKRVPVKVFFEFTAMPNWHKKADTLKPLQVAEKTYFEDDSGSSLMVKIQNTSINPILDLTVYAVLYDASKNAIGFSKTVVDEVPSQGSVVAPFTWQVNRKGSVISEEVLIVGK